MTEKMSHEEYVLRVRQRAVEICSGVLGGRIPVLEASHELASLSAEMEVDEWDEDFLAFKVISDEIEALPIGEARRHWAPAALEEQEPEIQAAVAWAMPQAIPACRSVVRRFAPKNSSKRTR